MPPTTTPFTITAPSQTDIWRKPPSKDIFNAPHDLLACIPLARFSSARVTFASAWKLRYDQGGLLLHLTKAGAADRWLKTGVEFYRDRPYISTVGCDVFADWSIYPVDRDADEYTVEVRREGDENGMGLWVYWVRNGEHLPVREVAWFFADEEGWDVAVGAMACRPAGSDDAKDDTLEVKFWDFDMQLVK